MGFCFNKAIRLKKKSEFSQVFTNSSKFRVRCFSVYYNKNCLSYPRLGIVVAKRNIRIAVIRNRIKRLIRERFRIKQDGLDSFDMIVVAYNGSDTLSNQEVFVCLEHFWRRLKKSQE